MTSTSTAHHHLNHHHHLLHAPPPGQQHHSPHHQHQQSLAQHQLLQRNAAAALSTAGPSAAQGPSTSTVDASGVNPAAVSAADSNSSGLLPANAWPHGPVALSRGRSAKDPNAHTTTVSVHNIDEFEAALRAYLDGPPAEPEHAECHLRFWIGASFMVNLNPGGAQPGANKAGGGGSGGGAGQGGDDDAHRVQMSIVEALGQTPDPKERMRKQRAIAKACVEAIQRVDGFRYSFHNNWNSREDDAFRFSYYCNDSLLNKDRAANGKGQKLGRSFCSFRARKWMLTRTNQGNGLPSRCTTAAVSWP